MGVGRAYGTLGGQWDQREGEGLGRVGRGTSAACTSWGSGKGHGVSDRIQTPRGQLALKHCYNFLALGSLWAKDNTLQKLGVPSGHLARTFAFEWECLGLQ